MQSTKAHRWAADSTEIDTAFTNQSVSAPSRCPVPPDSAFLSSPLPLQINVFYQQRKTVRLCMSNCRTIEVSVWQPLNTDPNLSILSDLNFVPGSVFSEKRDISAESDTEEKLELPSAMDADQGHHTADLSPTSNSTTTTSSHDTNNHNQELITSTSSPQPSPLLNLPLEIRLKIYTYLLPPRHHTIATQIPHNGYFYNTSTLPPNTTTSFYPFGTTTPPKLTTYKFLTSNYHTDFPLLTIDPTILRTCKQIRLEAEPLLYSQRETVFDFGVHIDAFHAFFNGRNTRVREWVRNVRVAREVPAWLGRDVYGEVRRDENWVEFCRVLKEEFKALRVLDLVLWSSSGSTAGFPTGFGSAIAASASATPEAEALDGVDRARVKEEERRRWREWDYTAELLQNEYLKEARITLWGFGSGGDEVEDVGAVYGSSRVVGTGFDSWVARRMVGDGVVRERMLRDGEVVEGVVVLPGVGGGVV